MKDKHNIDTLFKKLEKAEQNQFPRQEKIWQNIENQLDEKPQKKTIFYLQPLMMAASFVVLGVIGFLWWNSQSSPNSPMQENSSAKKEVYQISASDEEEKLSEEKAIQEEYGEMMEDTQNADIYAKEDNLNKSSNGLYEDDLPSQIKPTVEASEKTKSSAPKNTNSLRHHDSLAFKSNKAVTSADAGISTESRVNVKTKYDIEETAVPTTSKLAQDKDFYFVDGEQLSPQEFKKMESEDMVSMNYVSNEKAPQLGYIVFYNQENSRQEVASVLYWKKIKIENLKTDQLQPTYQQLLEVDTSKFSKTEMKQFNALKEAFKKRLHL